MKSASTLRSYTAIFKWILLVAYIRLGQSFFWVITLAKYCSTSQASVAKFLKPSCQEFSFTYARPIRLHKFSSDVSLFSLVDRPKYEICVVFKRDILNMPHRGQHSPRNYWARRKSHDHGHARHNQDLEKVSLSTFGKAFGQHSNTRWRNQARRTSAEGNWTWLSKVEGAAEQDRSFMRIGQ